MTVYTFGQTDSYVDDDSISAFTDDNGETVIITDVIPRVFTIHFV